MVKSYHPKSTTNQILEMNSWRKFLSQEDAMRGNPQKQALVLNKGVGHVSSRRVLSIYGTEEGAPPRSANGKLWVCETRLWQ